MVDKMNTPIMATSGNANMAITALNHDADTGPDEVIGWNKAEIPQAAIIPTRKTFQWLKVIDDT